MKVFVVLLAVIGTALAASLHGSVDKTANGLAALLAEKGGVPIGEISTRIVGGETTPITNVPYIASLQRLGSHRCGSVIIGPQKLLTAAHCMFTRNGFFFDRIPTADLSVRAGSSNSRSGGQVHAVHDFVNHPQYSHITLNNDITVVYLTSTLDFVPPGVATIGLPAQGAAVPERTSARVSGWGATSEGAGQGSELLRSVSVPVVSNADCNRMYNGGITAGMICAGFPEGGRDACQGDSGGPLTALNVVIGIVSWGQGCARPNFPGVYARVAHFTNWINSQHRPN